MRWGGRGQLCIKSDIKHGVCVDLFDLCLGRGLIQDGLKCRVRGVVQIRQLVGYQVRVGGFGGRKGLVADCGGDAGEGEDGGGVVLRCC